MAGDDEDTRPRPDPTVLTTQQMLRAVGAERDYVDGQLGILRERLNAIDVATRLLNETVNRTPTDIQKEITHLRELMQVEFQSVALQFKERDTRSERESRDNKVAVDAAFAAQKEAASEQNKSNTLAISKSETSTSETINKLAELVGSKTDALSDKVDDLKNQTAQLRQEFGQGQAGRQGGVDTVRAIYAFAGFVLVLLLIGGAIAAIVAARP
jgi:chromosome segregation ATPase